MTQAARWDASEAQRHLRNFYIEWPALVAALDSFGEENGEPSCPLLTDITAHGYQNARIKLMVVGRETRGWYDNWDVFRNRDVSDDKKVGLLLEEYCEI
jgi:hypothetical protein